MSISLWWSWQMVGRLRSFLRTWSFYFIHFASQDRLPACETLQSVLCMPLLIIAPSLLLCDTLLKWGSFFFSQLERTCFTFASFLHKSTSRSYPSVSLVLILHTLYYVWPLVMHFSVCVNHSPVPSLGNDAPAEESCWGLSVCRERSHWQPSIIESNWNPAPAGGCLAGWDKSFLEGSCTKSPVFVFFCFFHHAVHIWRFSSWCLLQALQKG